MKSTKKLLQKALISVVIAGSLLASPAAMAGICPAFNAPIVIAKTMAMEAALKALFQSMMNNLAKMLLGYDQKELGAMKVLTSQIATAAKAEMRAKESLAKAKTSALAYLDSMKNQMQVYRQYSPQTGQGVDPCAQLSTQQVLRVADTAAGFAAREWVRTMPAAPGRFGDPASYYRRQEQQRQIYGTENDEKLGLGKANKQSVATATGEKFPLAGADTNAAVLFADTSDQRVTEAKKAFLSNMAGPPDAPLPQAQAKSPAAMEYLMAKGRKDATMSAAMYSLSMVASENTPSAPGAKSKTTALREIRDMYYGGSAAARWAAWATQDMRGLKQDQMRLDAVTLAAKEEQYKSTQRLELLLGVMVVNKAREMGASYDMLMASIKDAKLQSPVN